MASDQEGRVGFVCSTCGLSSHAPGCCAAPDPSPPRRTTEDESDWELWARSEIRRACEAVLNGDDPAAVAAYIWEITHGE